MTLKDNPIDTTVDEITEWGIDEWTDLSDNPIPMTSEETQDAIQFLRANMYPKPVDCPMETCPGFRPACYLGTCYVAIRLCGDF